VRKLDDILAEQNRPDDRDLRSRTDARKERKSEEESLAHLAEQLVDLSPHGLSALELPEDVLGAVLEAQRISSAAARNRQLRVVRRTLRENDSGAIRQRIEALVHPPGPPDLERSIAAEWTDRLIAEGDEALTALIAEFPEADRQRLRQLVRRVHAAGPNEKQRARRLVLEAVGETLKL
jgi:ribosome-associated protein